MSSVQSHGGPERRPDTTPTTRAYRHERCGTVTTVGGEHFLRLANPFAVVGRTICMGCGRPVPIRRVAWCDTGENVAAFRKRLRNSTPLARRLFFSVLGLAAGAVPAFLGGYAAGLLLFGLMPNRPWWLQESGLIMGGISAFAGGQFGAQLIPAPLMRRMWGLDYRNVT